MPLSPPASRTPMHHRLVECQGFRRDDGLWDIEGHLVDTKPYDFANEDRGGRIRAGEPLHEMWIRLTIDEDMRIHAVEAVTDWAPFSLCDTIAADFSNLQGLHIGKGFLGEVRKRFAGTHGCTHLVELFGPLATTAYQTLYPARERKVREDAVRARPGVIDTCHALAADGPVVRRLWPGFYTGS